MTAKSPDLGKLRRQHPGAWYFAEHSLAASAERTPPDLAKHDGLLFCHVAPAAAGGWRLLTYWESRERFDAAATELIASSKLSGLVAAGFLHRPVFRKTPLWRRLTPATLLLQVVAILGAFAALETHGSWLFEPPELEAAIEGAPVNAIAGEPVDFEARLFSLCRRERLGLREVAAWLDAPSRNGADRRELEVSRSAATIGQGQAVSVRLTSQPLAPGFYPIVTSVRATAGVLRRPRTFLDQPGEVKVWRREAHLVSLEPRAGAADRLAWLDGTFEVGRPMPAGVECQLTLETDRVRFGMLRFPGLVDSRKVHRPELRLAQLWWQLGGQEEFYRARFEVSLETDHDGADWSRVASRIEALCTETRKRGGA